MKKVSTTHEGWTFEHIVKEDRSCLVSIMLNSRKRPSLLSKCIKDIISTSDQTNINYEIIVKIDSDDTETLNWLNLAPKLDNLYFIVGPRKKGYQSLILSIDDMTHMAHGKYILGIADDAVFSTPNWNNILEEKLTDFKFYFPKSRWPEGENQEWDTCWAIYPRKVVELWGDVGPHTLIDMWFRRLGERAGHKAWGLDLIEKIPEINIDHSFPDDEANAEKMASDGGDCHRTAVYHQQSKEFFHCLNLVKEYLISVDLEKIHKENIINEYKNNLEE